MFWHRVRAATHHAMFHLLWSIVATRKNSEPSHLPIINRHLHDCWINPRSITWLSSTSVLQIVVRVHSTHICNFRLHNQPQLPLTTSSFIRQTLPIHVGTHMHNSIQQISHKQHFMSSFAIISKHKLFLHPVSTHPSLWIANQCHRNTTSTVDWTFDWQTCYLTNKYSQSFCYVYMNGGI